MTFAEAAEAYELLQAGGTYRSVAKLFGLSNTHLGRVIKQCLVLGKAAPLVNAEHNGRPRTVSVKVVKRAMVLRDQGKHWKEAARTLGVDPEQLRKSVWHYDNYRAS